MARLYDKNVFKEAGNNFYYHFPVCEGITADITLPVPPDRVTFYPLDESGNRRQAIPISESGGRSVLSLDAARATVWYEAVIE